MAIELLIRTIYGMAKYAGQVVALSAPVSFDTGVPYYISQCASINNSKCSEVNFVFRVFLIHRGRCGSAKQALVITSYHKRDTLSSFLTVTDEKTLPFLHAFFPCQFDWGPYMFSYILLYT